MSDSLSIPPPGPAPSAPPEPPDSTMMNEIRGQRDAAMAREAELRASLSWAVGYINTETQARRNSSGDGVLDWLARAEKALSSTLAPTKGERHGVCKG